MKRVESRLIRRDIKSSCSGDTQGSQRAHTPQGCFDISEPLLSIRLCLYSKAIWIYRYTFNVRVHASVCVFTQYNSLSVTVFSGAFSVMDRSPLNVHLFLSHSCSHRWVSPVVTELETWENWEHRYLHPLCDSVKKKYIKKMHGALILSF